MYGFSMIAVIGIIILVNLSFVLTSSVYTVYLIVIKYSRIAKRDFKGVFFATPSVWKVEIST